jgi:hypothetical protein
MTLFDLSFAVAFMATHDVTVKRYSKPGFDAQGRAQTRTSTTVAARGSAQPVTGADLKRMPEGLSVTDARSVFITANVVAGDELVIGSERLQVVFVNDWSAAGNYTRAVARVLDAREI